MSKADAGFPPYSYVPGLWPHPHSHPAGHRFGPPYPPPQLDDIARDPTFRLGIDLFNAGYYWEAHEAWESLWHAAGRSGPLANLCKALIQLAVAGVKVREGRPDGVRSHARRAAELFACIEKENDGGLYLAALKAAALDVAANPPPRPIDPRQPVAVVFGWTIGR